MISFEWDEPKRRRNLAKHGIDFLSAEELFADGGAVTRPARSDTEMRFQTIGLVAGRCLTAIWTERNGRVRLISLRRSRDEEERYRRLLLG